MSATEKFEQYEVLKREDGSLFELGRGAMGITYKAVDTDLECFVALKIIKGSTIASTDAEQRFFREARAAAQLRHPNIASVFRLGKTDDGTHFYAMEYCEGQTLQQMVEQSGPIACRRALQFALQVTKALIVAEERHLVHRDLKPSNLIVTQRSDEGEVIKVIDFGLAKTTTPEGTLWSSLGTQGFIGTAHFASPEQIEDKPVDTRSDIYSLGSTLWFLLLGKPPFEGSLARIMSQHLTVAPDYAQLRGMPGKVITLIRRMMEKNAADRPQTAVELRREILECLEMPGEKEQAEKTEKAKTAVPVAEPPPLPKFTAAVPPASAPPPGEIRAPSLLDLLRVRSVLSPAEAISIGECLAAKLDQDRESARGALRIQDITIHFQDSPSAEQTRARLREDPNAWPAFDLVIHPGHAAAAPETLDPALMMTILPGADASGDKAQKLARLLYELMGGVAGSRYVPVARLGEAGNAVLQRAIAAGLAGYPTLRELIEKLEEARLAAPAPPPIAAPTRPFQSETGNGKPESGKTSHPPKLPAPVELSVPAPAGRRGRPYSEPPSLPPPVATDQTSKKTARPFRAGRALMAGAVAAGLIVLWIGVKKIQSHAVTPPVEKHDDIPATPPLHETATRSLQFTIDDDLGSDQISETVWVYMDDQTTPAATIHLTQQQAHSSAVMNLTHAGHHFFSIKAESVVYDRKKGSRKFLSFGRWEKVFKGGEEYDLTSSPQDNDSYVLNLNSKN